MLSGVRVTTRTTDRKRQRSSNSAEAPFEGDAASGSGVQRVFPSIAPAPAPGLSTATLAASAGFRIVQEEYTTDPPASERVHGYQRHGNPG